MFESMMPPMRKGVPHPKPQKPRYYFKEWRKKAGLTQEQLAERVGMTASSISQLEHGKQGFTDTTLEAMAWALNCEPADLLGRNPLKEGQVVDILALLRDRDPDLVRRVIEALPKRA